MNARDSLFIFRNNFYCVVRLFFPRLFQRRWKQKWCKCVCLNDASRHVSIGGVTYPASALGLFCSVPFVILFCLTCVIFHHMNNASPLCHGCNGLRVGCVLRRTGLTHIWHVRLLLLWFTPSPLGGKKTTKNTGISVRFQKFTHGCQPPLSRASAPFPLS